MSAIRDLAHESDKRLAQAERIAHYVQLGFAPTNGYGDGVVRMGLRAYERVELVVFIGECGDARDVQVWIDGAPQDIERIRAGIESEAAAMLADFHGHPNAIDETNGQAIRRTLTQEEHDELIVELDAPEPNRAKIARELADVIYVAYGTALAFDINLDRALREVHRAAMDKMDAGLRREDGKILKPPGFVPPSMASALR